MPSLPGSQPDGKLPVVFLLHSNVRILRYAEETLHSLYKVKRLHEEDALLWALSEERKPALLLLQWHTVQRSVAVLERVAAAAAGVPILLLNANADADEMRLALQAGASGFLEMPFSRTDLHAAVLLHLRTAAHSPGEAELGRQDAEPRETEPRETELGDGSSFLRSSEQMRAIEARAKMVAQTEIPVLLLGESGTGKEVLAKYIHQISKRSEKIFLKVNCAAMPAGLLESELFGYEQGAFTGAVRGKPGKFEICDGGTIFLDEIGEVHPALQAKLLHVLQDGVYSRLGGRSTMRADVRVIAATNVEMKVAIQKKLFRQDLYYRLNGFSITVPPLRERPAEILIFARHFLLRASAKYGRPQPVLSTSLQQALLDYSWPGNLREMENLMNRYLVVGDETSLRSDLADEVAARTPSLSQAIPAALRGERRYRNGQKDGTESALLASVLEETRWNRKAAAKEMQMSYKALLYRIKQYDLSPPAM